MNSPTAMAPQNFNPEENAMRNSAREAREAARAARNPNSHYRRARSPPTDDYRFSGGENEEPRTPNSDVVLQDALLAQAHNQRAVPVEQQASRNPGQRRRPVANAPVNRAGPPQANGPPAKGMPPSYPGVALEDGPQSQQPPARYGQYRRQPGARRASGSDQMPPGQRASPGTGSPPRQQNQQQRPQSMMAPDTQQRRPPSPGGQSISGASINRLNSPSIAQSVLQPLEKKIHEYDHLMQEAHAQMLQLDEELRALQERRRQAEERFVEAKNKHDDYERQHQDVGRALRGELPVPRPASPPRPMIPRMESIESFDDRPMSNQSTRSQQKAKGRGLRMSLFK